MVLALDAGKLSAIVEELLQGHGDNGLRKALAAFAEAEGVPI